MTKVSFLHNWKWVQFIGTELYNFFKRVHESRWDLSVIVFLASIKEQREHQRFLKDVNGFTAQSKLNKNLYFIAALFVRFPVELPVEWKSHRCHSKGKFKSEQRCFLQILLVISFNVWIFFWRLKRNKKALIKLCLSNSTQLTSSEDCWKTREKFYVWASTKIKKWTLSTALINSLAHNKSTWHWF